MSAEYPPPAGGGLIEAQPGVHTEKDVAAYPPPAGGGLIEARRYFDLDSFGE